MATCSNVMSNICQAPANLEGATTRSKCTSCGEAVCLECSLVTSVEHRPTKARVCFNCLMDLGRGEQVANAVWRQAGYSGKAPERVAEAYCH